MCRVRRIRWTPIPAITNHVLPAGRDLASRETETKTTL